MSTERRISGRELARSRAFGYVYSRLGRVNEIFRVRDRERELRSALRSPCSSWLALLALALAPRLAAAQASGGFPVDEPAPVTPPPQPQPPASAPPVAPPAALPPPVVSAPSPAAPPVAPPTAPEGETRAAAPAPANLSLPYVLPYRSGVPVPPGYHVESHGATGLIVTGAITLGLGYVVALGLGLDSSFSGSRGWLAVPVVGPWPAVGGEKITCVAETVPEARQCLDRASNTATTLALMAVDGMVQTTGLALLIAGLATRHSELVRDDLPVNVSARQRPEGGFDLGVSGRF